MTRKIIAVIFAALIAVCTVSGCDINSSLTEINDIVTEKEKDYPVKAGYCEIEH